MRGFLVVGYYNHPTSYQVLTVAKNENDAIEVSGLDKSEVSYVFPWDGRWKFYYYGSLMNIKYYLENCVSYHDAHIVTNEVNRDIAELLRNKERKEQSAIEKLNLPKTQIKSEVIEGVRKMMVEAYNETDRGGFDEWDQTFIDLLRDKLVYHLDTEGLSILMDTIEKNSIR